MKTSSIRTICYIALLTAVICVLSIWQIMTPWGVPYTLQTFAIALCGYVLGKKFGTISTGIYILLGTVGVPVFSGMKSGPQVLIGATGGYIFGFLILAFCCGLAMELFEKKKKYIGIPLFVLFSILGIAGCHALGVIVLRIVAIHNWIGALMGGTVPYLAKDAIMVALAFALAIGVRAGLRSAKLLSWDTTKETA